MPRVPRLDFPNARHHVMNRGARRAPIFGDDEARRLFVDVLAELPERFGVVVHGYAVMPNHFHLLVTTPRANLSRAMRHLCGVYTQALNRAKGWDGPVFRGRYKNRVAGDRDYWMHLLCYLHLNPVPSLVRRPEGWPWSSHRAYLGLDPTPPWLTTEAMLGEYRSVERLAAYIEDHRLGRGEAPPGWDPAVLWTPERTATVGSGELPPDDRPLLSHQAVAEVARVTGRTPDDLATGGRGRRDNRARWVAVWWLVRRADLTHREIARRMECSAVGVAQMLRRLRELEDPEVEAWKAALEDIRWGRAP